MIGMIRNISFSGFNNINNTQNAGQNIAFTGKIPRYLVEAMRERERLNSGDIFIKSTDIQEDIDPEKLKQDIPNDFITWAESTNFIQNGLKDALKPENLIGEGFDHAVYKIPDNPDYVLRIKRSYYGQTQDVDYSHYQMEDTRDMALTGNYGQQVAILIDNDGMRSFDVVSPIIEVLVKQNGFPNANPSPKALYHENGTLREEVIPYEDDSRKRHFVYSMKTLAEMPDEAYDKLILDLLEAGEAGYKFDPLNSNNFLIDPENQEINIIDMGPAPKPYKDRFGNSLYALINLEFLGEYLRDGSGYVPETPNEQNETIGNMLTIMDKYTAAMKRKLQKYNTQSSYQFHLLLHHMISTFWLRAMDYNEKVNKLREMGVLYEGPDA